MNNGLLILILLGVRSKLIIVKTSNRFEETKTKEGMDAGVSPKSYQFALNRMLN
jgi:hypothetical protein